MPESFFQIYNGEWIMPRLYNTTLNGNTDALPGQEPLNFSTRDQIVSLSQPSLPNLHSHATTNRLDVFSEFNEFNLDILEDLLGADTQIPREEHSTVMNAPQVGADNAHYTAENDIHHSNDADDWDPLLTVLQSPEIRSEQVTTPTQENPHETSNLRELSFFNSHPNDTAGHELFDTNTELFSDDNGLLNFSIFDDLPSDIADENITSEKRILPASDDELPMNKKPRI